ncbi:MAG: hypothetical protein HY721_29370, partial [Planctomycetes bacterium]|nr:hypothetical protein [Planctomycetota bacterium]
PFHDLGEVIFTDVTIRVEGMLKGPLDTKDVTVQILGGEIGTAFQRCPESPRFERGEKVLVFLRDYHGALWTTGWLQGKYALSREGLSVKGVEGLPVPRDVTLEALKAEVRVWTAPTAAPPAGGSTPVLRKAERATKEGGSR